MAAPSDPSSSANEGAEPDRPCPLCRVPFLASADLLNHLPDCAAARTARLEDELASTRRDLAAALKKNELLSRRLGAFASLRSDAELLLGPSLLDQFCFALRRAAAETDPSRRVRLLFTDLFAVSLHVKTPLGRVPYTPKPCNFVPPFRTFLETHRPFILSCQPSLAEALSALLTPYVAPDPAHVESLRLARFSDIYRRRDLLAPDDPAREIISVEVFDVHDQVNKEIASTPEALLNNFIHHTAAKLYNRR